MKLTQQELHKGIILLNSHAFHIKGNDLSLYIHYWGAEASLNSNPIHKHSFFEFCYVANGTGTYVEQGVTYSLSKGSLFITRPHMKHQILTESDSNLYLVFVAVEPIMNECSERGSRQLEQLATIEPFILEQQENSVPAMLWEALLTMTQQSPEFMSDSVINLSCALLASLNELFLTHRELEYKITLQRQSTTLVHQAKLYIRDNLSQPLRLKEVADYLHISSRHLSRLFSDELGATFSDYIRNERINQATLMLSNKEMSIKSISIETGFTSVHYFTTVFKEVMGVTPGEFYRKLKTQD